MLLSSLLVSYNGYFEDETDDHYDYPDVWTSFAKDSLASVFLYVAIALAVILIAVGAFVYWKRRDKFGGYLKTAIALAVGFAGTVIVAMLALEFLDMKESGAVIDMVLYPAIVLGSVAVLGIAASSAKRRLKSARLSLFLLWARRQSPCSSASGYTSPQATRRKSTGCPLRPRKTPCCT